MMDNSSERVLQRYLGEIESELEQLPRSVRREITAEIRSHLVEKWRRCSKPTEENMLNIINNFGEPGAIAAGYLEERSTEPARSEASSACLAGYRPDHFPLAGGNHPSLAVAGLEKQGQAHCHADPVLFSCCFGGRKASFRIFGRLNSPGVTLVDRKGATW